LLYNYAAGGRSPLLPFPRLRGLGYAIIILPVDMLLVATKAMAGFLAELRAGDDARSLGERAMSFAEFNALIGVTDHMALADRYRDT
jgi:2-methylisocitrate lyase-like PEP mutase family enzyme